MPIPAHEPPAGTAYPLILRCLDYTVDLGLRPGSEACGSGQLPLPDDTAARTEALHSEHFEAIAMAEAAVESAEWELDRARHARRAALAAARLAGVPVTGADSQPAEIPQL